MCNATRPLPARQRGQILVLGIVFLVGLLAFAGFAMDGVLIFQERARLGALAENAAAAAANENELNGLATHILVGAGTARANAYLDRFGAGTTREVNVTRDVAVVTLTTPYRAVFLGAVGFAPTTLVVTAAKAPRSVR